MAPLLEKEVPARPIVNSTERLHEIGRNGRACSLRRPYHVELEAAVIDADAKAARESNRPAFACFAQLRH